jgi:DNA ligase (NAD+)
MTKINIPDNCPCCDSPLTRVNDQLFCVNKACPAQLFKRLEHFAKTLNIKGFGPKTIEKLDISSIEEIYFLDREDLVAALGSEKVADKLLEEIENSKTASLDKVLASFSIPLFGQTLARRLVEVIGHVDEINETTCQRAGLGPKVTANLIYWLETEYAEIGEFLPFSWSVQPVVANSVDRGTICITGKLQSFKTKDEAYQTLKSLGFNISESMTSKVQYLVDETDKMSSKRKRAEELGTTIIPNLKNFLESL